MGGWQRAVGVVLGLIVGLVLVSIIQNGRRSDPPAGPILSECDGRLKQLVIQYEPGAKSIVSAAYHDFIGALDSDVTVHVVCPDAESFTELQSLLGNVRCQLSPVLTHHPITTWSRDRWIALMPLGPGGPTTLWMPRSEAAGEVWPARAGDQRVGQDLAGALSPAVNARRSSLLFDGGDFLADEDRVFVVSRALQRNLEHTVSSREEFLEILGRELRRPVVLLDPAPDHHAGMFMASVGGNRMLVADPSLAKASVDTSETGADGEAAWMNLPGGPDFSPSTQQLFDAVADQCAAAGYTVTRIPTLPAGDGRTYLTYLNVLLDTDATERIVYLPYYRGAEKLNAAAQRVWQDLGYKVRPVDCTAVYPHSGSLHCLVSVLTRS